MFNLVLGRQGTGKTTVIYNQIKKSLKNGEDNLLLIVPEQYTLEAEKELVTTLNSQGILHVEVISFSTLIKRVMEEVGGISKTKLTNTGKQMVIQRIMDDQKDLLMTYGGVTNRVGLLEGLQEIISNMKKRRISSEALEFLIEDYSLENELLYKKLHDLYFISTAYDKWLGDDYIDEESAIDHVIEHISNSKLMKNTSVWIDGFHTYTQQIYRLIQELLNLCNNVTITLTHPIKCNSKDREIFEINEVTKEKLYEISTCEPKIIPCYYQQREKSSEILFIEKEFFASPSQLYQGDVHDIEIYQCKDIYSEMDELCIYILNLVQNQRYRWKDICVLTNDLKGYEFLIKRYMDEYDIPRFIDTKKSITDKPLSILIMNTLKAITYRYPYEETFALIKSGLLDISAQEYEILENYVLKYNIKGNQWTKDFYKLIDNDIYDLDVLNHIRRIIVEPIELLKQNIVKNGTYYGISYALYEYMRMLHIEEKIDKQINDLKDEFLWEYAAEFAQVYNRIINILDELVEIFGQREVDIREYLRVFEIGIQSVKLAIIPSTLDQIFVGDITRSRNANVKVICVVGANEGILPAQNVNSNILTDYEHIILKNEGIELIDDSYHQGVQEKYLLYNVLSKGKDKLMISYPLADFEGNALRPSIYIEQLKTVFPQINERWEHHKNYPNILSAKGTLKHLISYYRDMYESGKPRLSIYDEAYLWYFKDERYNQCMHHIKEGLTFSNQVKKLDTEVLKHVYKNDLTTSVTRLESYIQCPFKHFVKYMLKPKDREIYQVSIPDIGELLHTAIHDYSYTLKKDNIEWSDVDEKTMRILCEGVINNITKEYKNGIFEDNAKYGYLKNYLSRIFLRSINTLTVHYKQGDFTILGNELEFGDNKALPQVTFDISNDRKLHLEGRIDRIDILVKEGKHYLKILDFKTGNKDLSLSEIYNGLSLQLLVYMWACLNFAEQKEWEVIPAGMFYFKIDDPLILTKDSDPEVVKNEIIKYLRLHGIMLKNKKVYEAIDNNYNEKGVLHYTIKNNGEFSAASRGLIDEESIYRLIRHVQSLIRHAGEEMFSGEIKIRPIKTEKGEACDYCDYNTICFFDPALDGSEYCIIKELDEESIINSLNKDQDE